jgi:hypothetical protein
MSGRLRRLPTVTLRIEPNAAGSHLVWNITADDGTKSSGFAKSHADAMRDAAAFVEAMTQPRAGGLFTKPELRIVGDPAGLVHVEKESKDG